MWRRSRDVHCAVRVGPSPDTPSTLVPMVLLLPVGYAGSVKKPFCGEKNIGKSTGIGGGNNGI